MEVIMFNSKKLLILVFCVLSLACMQLNAMDKKDQKQETSAQAPKKPTDALQELIASNQRRAPRTPATPALQPEATANQGQSADSKNVVNSPVVNNDAANVITAPAPAQKEMSDAMRAAIKQQAKTDDETSVLYLRYMTMLQTLAANNNQTLKTYLTDVERDATHFGLPLNAMLESLEERVRADEKRAHVDNKDQKSQTPSAPGGPTEDAQLAQAIAASLQAPSTPSQPKPQAGAVDRKAPNLQAENSGLCTVCLEDKKADEIRILHCGHTFCAPCLKGIFDGFLEEKILNAQRCPDCNKAFVGKDFIAIAPPEKLAEVINILLNLKVVSQPNQELTDKDKKWFAENTKECPQCNVRIEKNEGCNHMTCRQCTYQFCWVCSKPWKLDARDGGHGACSLPEEEEEDAEDLDEPDDGDAKAEINAAALPPVFEEIAFEQLIQNIETFDIQALIQIATTQALLAHVTGNQEGAQAFLTAEIGAIKTLRSSLIELLSAPHVGAIIEKLGAAIKVMQDIQTQIAKLHVIEETYRAAITTPEEYCTYLLIAFAEDTLRNMKKKSSWIVRMLAKKYTSPFQVDFDTACKIVCLIHNDENFNKELTECFEGLVVLLGLMQDLINIDDANEKQKLATIIRKSLANLNLSVGNNNIFSLRRILRSTLTRFLKK